MLRDPHISVLTAYVEALKREMGTEYHVPYFDPLDGGTNAECLFLLEAPGPKAVASGFVSRNNPDETAKNFFELNTEVGIRREQTVLWNIVPWYIGSGSRIRPATTRDLGQAAPALERLLKLLPRVRIIVLVGKKAALAKEAISTLAPSTSIYLMPHPSPMYVNRSPENRGLLRRHLEVISALLQGAKKVGFSANSV